MQNIYLDNAATTPLDLRVFEAMKPFFIETFGNPSSSHLFGRAVRSAIDGARDRLASTLGAHSSEVYFTSGGTESDNLAIIGTATYQGHRKKHLITQITEHHAVLDSFRWLEGRGFEVTYLPVDSYGMVDPSDLEDVLTDDTLLVSIMHANNEVGTVQPIRELAKIAHCRGALFHTDAVQSFGMLPVDVRELDVDLLSISSHKIYGPKGTGALYLKRGVRIEPLFHGGGQEREIRPGTENAAGIVGFAEATRIACEIREETSQRVKGLRDAFVSLVTDRIPDAVLNGHPTERLPGNVNFSFIGADSESLLLSLDMEGIAVSSGSACSAGSIEPSHVLLGMGFPSKRSHSAIRFSLGRKTTDQEIEETVRVLEAVVARIRG